MTEEQQAKPHAGGRAKFVVGFLLMALAIVYLIVSSTQAAAQYYLTVDELAAKGDSILGRDLRISGAVDGDTITYDPQTLTLRFTIANVPGDMDEIAQEGGLAEVLHQAVADPTTRRLQVIYIGAKPDLLRNEAQAIITGRIGEDGVFQASELLLKCPTRYEEELPLQASGA